ncbi:MAG: tripartite tricarboxylate transporter permease [Desulfobacteraceae bacterium]|nr:MAG: tripartite tricarboxylate transporter permease [Desulfobacteraceae bacterium]
MGTIVGVLPGVGPTATMTLMLPFTFMYGPSIGLITLTGVLCGAMYGGSTTSILVNIPGEAASVVTCIDGYQMAKKGRGGAALALVAVGSFLAATLGIFGLQLFGPMLGRAALAFGPPEYFSFMILAFLLLSALTGGSMIKSFVMMAIGFWLSSIGVCPLDNASRFTFGLNDLMLGVEFVPVAVGLFGITELFSIVIEKYVPPKVSKIRLRELYPQKAEIRRAVFPSIRGSILGFFVGLLPGPSAVVSSFLSYSIEKRISKHPEEFGKGAVEGLVGPESANNSAAIGTFIPLLTLGIPFAPSSAVLLAGLLTHNVEPGPLLFQNSPEIFWSLIAALYVGNIMLLLLNLPLVGVFARLAAIKPKYLMPFIAIVCILGVYSVRNSFFDVWVMFTAGIMGLVFRGLKYPIPPLIIGLILGPMTENSLRKTLLMFRGNLSLFLSRPIAMTFFALVFGVILFKILYPRVVKKPVSV